MASAEEVDFICLGAGLGGMAAAIRAHDLGLSTIVLEKSDQLGGVAAYSSGQLWAAGNHLAAGNGEPDDSWEEGFSYLSWVSEGTSDDGMLETFCRTAPEAFAYYEREAGVRWCPLGLPDAHWPDAPGSRERGRFIELEPFDGRRLPEKWRDIVRHSPKSLFSNRRDLLRDGWQREPGDWDPELAASRRAAQDTRYQGSALAAYFVMAVGERGIPMIPNVEVTGIIAGNGGVAGVTARVDGEERRFLASKGLLVAIGGYDWNPELVLRFDKRTDFGSRLRGR